MMQDHDIEKATGVSPSQDNAVNQGKKSTSTTSLSDGALRGYFPHSLRGCGCLCLLGLYFILGFFQIKDISWPKDWGLVLAYCLSPFAWPIAISGWTGITLYKTLLAISGLAIYAFLLNRLFAATSHRAIFLVASGLTLLFVASVGGCAMELDRSFK